MHDDRSIVEARLRRIVNERINPAIWGDRRPLTVSRWEAPGEPVSAAEAGDQSYEAFAVGQPFGRPWGTTWFRMHGEVPPEWAGCAVDAVIDLGFTNSPGFQSEGLMWTVGDDATWRPVRGLHPLNRDVFVTSSAVGGEVVDYVVEAASNPPIAPDRPDPNSDVLTASTSPMYALARAELAVVRPEVAALRHDIRALNGLMKQLPVDQPRRHEILRALEAMLDRLVLDDIPGTAAAARSELTDVLSRPAHPSAHRISAIGHAHIDSAWLWPLRETVRKCARTFSNVLALMDRYPEFRFGCSQAVQYEWMREHYPTIFEGIRQRVAEGRWIPIGGMWVEADTNLAGGEALVRQITHGQRYFEEHFGVTCSEVWIPDVFGYPASLPQIMRICGIERFLTQKLSWNKTNRFPHHTFWWEGIDGSTVFTHFPPVETYNANFSGMELARAVTTFADKGRATRSLMPFGHGDGGGGPTEQMLEQFRRVRDLEGSPRVEIESPEAFFDAAMEEYPDAPRWVGELYFEMHRGTFTSQAGTKAGNRRCELLLREAELWCASAYGGGDGYPAAELDRLWKIVLLHQFHDILPGSSIGWVHREAEVAYSQVAADLGRIVDRALDDLAPSRDALANPAPHDIDGVVLLDAPSLATDPACQTLSDGRVAAVVSIPALGLVVADPLEPAVAPVEVTNEGGAVVLDNGVVRVVIDGRGLVTSLVEVAGGREVVAPGAAANLLQLHPDLPIEYDAWDIEEYYRRQVVDLVDVESIDVLDRGPLVARVAIARSFRSSTIRQVVEVRAGSARVDVVNDVDWHEHEQLLKVAVPVDVHCDEIRREIQFGHLRSPIHTNTSWDAARFEVCAHRWVDAAEPGFGVALLNDCKYGYDVTRTRHAVDGREVPTTTLRLTLLRGARYPDPEQDQGRHRFTYAILPHRGGFDEAGVVAEGYRLNTAVRWVPASRRADEARSVTAPPVVAVSDPGVVVETVKAADDGSGDLIVRCYESWGRRTRCGVSVAGDGELVVVDARERAAIGAAPVAGGEIELRPFQVLTLRLQISGRGVHAPMG